MTNERKDTSDDMVAEAADAPVAVRLQQRSASIAAHSSNHATLRNPGFAWR